MAHTSNPLASIHVPVPWHEVRAEHVESAVDELLARAQARLDAIHDAPRTYDATLGALDLATSDLDYAMNVASHLEAVDGTPEMRAAYNKILPKVSAFGSKIMLSEPLYRAMRDLAATDEPSKYDPGRARFLKKTLADFRRNGAELDEAGKARLAEIDVALSEQTLKFAQNVVDATAAFEVIVTDEKKLSGLPEGAVEAAAASAKDKGKSGWRFTLQAPSYGPVLSFADDRALREALYRANVTRASSGQWDNRPVIRQVLALRHEKARLLGFAHFADLAIDDRMAKTGKDALAFVTMLKDKLAPAFARENEELAKFAREGGQKEPLAPWDVAYWAEKQRRALYAFDEETLRPYHPLDRLLAGLFEIAEQIYGVKIARDTAAPVWHEDATAWAVLDHDGRRLGAFYLDLFPRETKRDGAWMGGVIDRLPGTKDERENVAVIVCNVTPPRKPGQQALLNHREVETLFHEFGHMMHHLLSEVAIRSMAGTRVVSDFVELPSMIMENWTWERDALDRFARHHETGAPIPDDVKDRMLRARTYRAANALVRQLGFSTVDLLLHTEYDAAKHGDVMTYARDVFAKFSPVPLPAEYAMLASFSHLFGAAYGYAAGYYSYQWSEVLEADAFGRFREAGILSREVGDAFRKSILARGDTEDPAALYRSFLGRDPDVNALLRRLGVAS
ncbi:MAG: M3 family metallopeptidase [Labilithrix sp.]|nr:M3 family metallopeptidase [Labilithrix sp.]MCW5812801.1 M3 family metallopeptidase [Labilithrix sp.]